jgi:hypothetical protein
MTFVSPLMRRLSTVAAYGDVEDALYPRRATWRSRLLPVGRTCLESACIVMCDCRRDK